MVGMGGAVGFGSGSTDPSQNGLATLNPQVDVLQHSASRVLVERNPLGAFVRPPIEDPMGARHIGFGGSFPSGVGGRPSDTHDRLVEPAIDDRALLLEQVPHQVPDMGIRVRMSAAVHAGIDSVQHEPSEINLIN